MLGKVQSLLWYKFRMKKLDENTEKSDLKIGYFQHLISYSKYLNCILVLVPLERAFFALLFGLKTNGTRSVGTTRRGLLWGNPVEKRVKMAPASQTTWIHLQM